jgi:DNA end-binding protein Ku
MRVRDGVLVLHTMRWPDEIRRPDFAFLDEDVSVRPQELQMAEALISSMSGAFDPTEFTDDYREAMTALLEAKQSGGEVAQPPEVPDDGAAVVDLMSALRRSVERARGGGSAAEDATDDAADGPAQDAAPAEKAPAEKAPAEKAPAKKAPAKRAPATKAAAAEKAPATKAPATKTPATKAAAGSAAASTAAGTTAKTAAKKTASAAKPPAKRARRSA